jgi:hypothetical protein
MTFGKGQTSYEKYQKSSREQQTWFLRWITNIQK